MLRLLEKEPERRPASASMAMTAIDVFTDKHLRQAMCEEFEKELA